jgi:general secretion pathway protein C
MIARLSAFFVWGLLACCSGYWLLQLGARPLATPAQALAVTDQGPLHTDLGRLLGVTPAEAAPLAAPVQSRYELLGVVAPKSEAARRAGEGVALIAVDGQPRTVRVGAAIEEGFYLLSVEARSATLGGEGKAELTLQIAPHAAPATGQLAPAAPSTTVLGGMPPQALDPQAPPLMQQGAQVQQQPPRQPLQIPTQVMRSPTDR